MGMAHQLSEEQKAVRRAQLQARFKELNLEELETFLRLTKSVSKLREVSWKIRALTLAKSGDYYLTEVAKDLGLIPSHVAMAFGRIEELKGEIGVGWPYKPRESKLAQIVNGIPCVPKSNVTIFDPGSTPRKRPVASPSASSRLVLSNGQWRLCG